MTLFTIFPMFEIEYNIPNVQYIKMKAIDIPTDVHVNIATDFDRSDVLKIKSTI